METTDFYLYFYSCKPLLWVQGTEISSVSLNGDVFEWGKAKNQKYGDGDSNVRFFFTCVLEILS